MENAPHFSSISTNKYQRGFSKEIQIGGRYSQLNNRGFVTTMAVTLLPIMIFGGLAAFSMLWFIEKKEQVQWICESQNIKSQNALTAAANKLLAMNLFIESTVLEKKWVQKALAAAPHPAAKAALAARLLMLKIKLAGYAQQQQATILAAHMSAGRELSSIRQQLTHITRTMEALLQIPLHLHFSTSRAQLRLRRKRIDPMASLYLEHPLFTTQQEISVRIAFTSRELLPKWMRWATQRPIQWQESCKSHPKKENTQWFARLQVDRF